MKDHHSSEDDIWSISLSKGTGVGKVQGQDKEETRAVDQWWLVVSPTQSFVSQTNAGNCLDGRDVWPDSRQLLPSTQEMKEE